MIIGRLDTLVQLLSVTCDGNLISKSDTDELVKNGFASKVNGFNFITKEGIMVLEKIGILKHGYKIPKSIYDNRGEL